ncbi:hypothetical protein V494_04113 [Pseudogymnoascus sp. VKM F-4513 (FW-928)]|nr:hypothetical protein V494_04113 [Pseudogymnoascus sp. VKM F-4513 (FW-928)]
MPVSHAPSASDEFVSGRPRPTSLFAAETSPPLPVPSATFEIVSAMPECLQSRPKPTSLDLPGWVDNTNRHTIQSPGGIVDDEMIPWMQLPQPEFSGISKAQYRETPLYSGPGSPDLTRAYATEEVQCPQPRPRIPSWATFGFAGDSYPGFEVPASLSRGSLAGSGARNGSSYYGDASEDERASVLSRRSSGLSIMCQGHSALELSPLAFEQPTAQPVAENTLPKSTGCEFMDWAENESSGRSSMCYSERAYEVRIRDSACPSESTYCSYIRGLLPVSDKDRISIPNRLL